MLHARLSQNRGTEPATTFLRELKEEHRVADAEFSEVSDPRDARWVVHLLDGQAKAMVVTGSRQEAVRYQLAMDKYIRKAGYEDVHPLVAFAVYFGLWHSLGHILELIRFFRTQDGEVTTIPAFYKKAALYTIVSFIGLGLLYAATQSFGLQDQMIALLFILISVVTLPHMVIVERLYQKREDVAPSRAA